MLCFEIGIYVSGLKIILNQIFFREIFILKSIWDEFLRKPIYEKIIQDDLFDVRGLMLSSLNETLNQIVLRDFKI